MLCYSSSKGTVNVKRISITKFCLKLAFNPNVQIPNNTFKSKLVPLKGHLINSVHCWFMYVLQPFNGQITELFQNKPHYRAT
jgi:hypothetical protein